MSSKSARTTTSCSTTSGGLYRYDIQDVVRCVGFEGQAPLVEFLNKGKHFCSLTGEKLSEHQAVSAVKASFAELKLPIETFTLGANHGQSIHGMCFSLNTRHFTAARTSSRTACK